MPHGINTVQGLSILNKRMVNFLQDEVITMAHGSGGAAGHELMEKILLPAFDNKYLKEMHDGAKLDLATGKIAFTTDSYVVKPLFFAGGNIGKLDLAASIRGIRVAPVDRTGGIGRQGELGICQRRIGVTGDLGEAQLGLIALDGGDLEVEDLVLGPLFHSGPYRTVLINEVAALIGGALLLHTVDVLSLEERILQLGLAVGEVVFLSVEIRAHVVQADPICHGVDVPIAFHLR